MSIIFLHHANLQAAKSALRASLPTVQSGHLTEALATGLGFRTQAALLAGMLANGDRPAILAVVDDNGFAARLTTLGYPAPPTSLLTDLVRSSVIPDRPVAEFREGDRRANDDHYARCSRLGRPMMMIKPGRTYATLEWDCVTIDGTLDATLYTTNDGVPTHDVMDRLFRNRVIGAPGKPHYKTTVFVGWVYKLLLPTARLLAEDYYRLLYRTMRPIRPRFAA